MQPQSDHLKQERELTSFDHISQFQLSPYLEVTAGLSHDAPHSRPSITYVQPTVLSEVQVGKLGSHSETFDSVGEKSQPASKTAQKLAQSVILPCYTDLEQYQPESLSLSDRKPESSYNNESVTYDEATRTYRLGRYSWKEADKIGDGTYSQVFACLNHENNRKYALKIIDIMQSTDPDAYMYMKNEIAVLQSVQSPYLVKMYAIFNIQAKSYIVMDLCETDLRKYMNECGGMLPEQEAIGIMKQVVYGMKSLIDKGFVHRDIKPSNILKQNQKYILADFSFAIKVDPNGKKKIQDFCGSPYYEVSLPGTRMHGRMHGRMHTHAHAHSHTCTHSHIGTHSHAHTMAFAAEESRSARDPLTYSLDHRAPPQPNPSLRKSCSASRTHRRVTFGPWAYFSMKCCLEKRR